MTSSTKIELTFGVGLRADGTAIRPSAARQAVETVVTLACDTFGGCSLIEHTGEWINFAGVRCTETSRTLVIVTQGTPIEKSVDALVALIKSTLGQEKVLVVTSACQSALK